MDNGTGAKGRSEEILQGLICAYCFQKTELVESTEIYGRDYGAKMYRCKPCDAYVSCHEGTEKSKGRVAKVELRALKILVHKWFDPLWRAKADQPGMSKGRARGAGYKWLAGQLKIDVKLCHIGMFDEKQCREALNACHIWYLERDSEKLNTSNDPEKARLARDNLKG